MHDTSNDGRARTRGQRASHKNGTVKGTKNGRKAPDATSGPRSTTASLETLDKKQLLVALSALKKGEFAVRLPVEWEGLDGKIADAFNEVVERNERLAV